MHERCKYLKSTFCQAKLENNSNLTKHQSLTRREVNKSERYVQKCMDSILNFIDPFSVPEKDHLFIISSGSKVVKEIEYDVLNAEKLGEEEHKKFVKKWLKMNSNSFYPICKLRLKTMANSSKKVKLKTTTNKVVKLKVQGNIAF